ncbi:MAG TPA: HAD-IB family phosphatase [Bryobacteraceae bacterium]|nr:HAD-IB family phosphatase [Bryobacteraceae bacterium]
MAHSVLVSDFDGTITQKDFYALIADRYMTGDPYDAWRRYRAGEISHFDAMQSFFSHAPEHPVTLNHLLDDVDPDPRLAEAAKQLEVNGWDLTIVSAGSSWYIDRILARFGVHAVVHANPGEIKQGQGLVLEAPTRSRFFCPDVGISKKAVVLDAISRYAAVAFAGDGPPDVAPSLLVPPEFRFARGYLAEELARRGENFHPYTTWAEIVDYLTRETTPRADASI